jgi:SIR2-like domain
MKWTPSWNAPRTSGVAAGGGTPGELDMPIVERWVPIAELMLEGKIVPFLGAGASSYHVDENVSNNPDLRGPPTGRRLLDIIAKEAGIEAQCRRCPKPAHDLAQVASYYARVEHTRRQLDSKLLRLTGDAAFRPNPLHKLLARVAMKQPMLLITTNYDTLLEKAFDLAGAPYEVVATAADRLAYRSAGEDTDEDGVELHPAGPGPMHADVEAAMIYPASVRAELKDRSLIYKVHGTVATGGWKGGYLIAEEDYVRFLGSMDQAHICPFAIRNRLRKKVILPGGQKALLHSLFFLGYSLNDWNLRVLLDGLGVGNGGPDERHYAILRNPDPVTKQLLQKRNITVHNADLNDLVSELGDTLDELTQTMAAAD